MRAWYLCSISNICALPSHKLVIDYRYIFGIKNISFLCMPIALDCEIRILKVYAFLLYMAVYGCDIYHIMRYFVLDT